MNTTLDPTVALIAANLLETASRQFANHGCNDYVLANTPENHAFVQRMLAASTDPEDHNEEPHVSDDETSIYVYDWITMDYCAGVLRGYAGVQEGIL